MLEFCGGEVGDRLEIHFFSSCLSLPGQGCGCVPMGGGQPAAAAVRGSCGQGWGFCGASHSCFHGAQGGTAKTGTWPLLLMGLSYTDSKHLSFLVSHLCLLL